MNLFLFFILLWRLNAVEKLSFGGSVMTPFEEINPKYEKEILQELQSYFCSTNETLKFHHFKESTLFFTEDQKKKSKMYYFNQNEMKIDQKYVETGKLYKINITFSNRNIHMKMREKVEKLYFIEHVEPKSTQNSFDRKKITLLSFNLFNFNQNWKLRFSMIVDLIREKSPDFIGFQEIRYHGSGGEFQFDFLKEKLIPEGYLHFSFQSSMFYQHDNEEEGLAVFSKYPIIHSEYILLGRNLKDHNSHQRICMFTEILFNNQHVQLFNTHLSLNLKMNYKNSKEVIKFMNKKLNPMKPQFLVGDMNAEPNEKSILHFEKFLYDSWNQLKRKEFEFTFPTIIPKKRIDFIFYRNSKLVHFETINRNYQRWNSSDHFGVISTFDNK
jgi:endonuclease/exonuclease/phosphatase family metal-dependent hydrolase